MEYIGIGIVIAVIIAAGIIIYKNLRSVTLLHQTI